MRDGSLNVSVGARLWYLGSAWTVVELDGALVTLRSSAHLKKVHGSSLVGSATSLDDNSDVSDSGELEAVALSALNPGKRSEVERQAQVFDELVMAPSSMSANERYQAAADELGISLRTAYRRGQRYAEKGIAGLVDSRQLRPSRPTVDPLWDAICVEVLEEYRDQSNPTMKTVLKKANALFAARFPSKVGPSRSVGYRRIRELDKGRYTFGAAKQRRSVAERPQGHMGRLRADRPGQYVVLDTTRLDVFAMEPITGRWLNTELTVAMDLYSRCILGMVLRAVSTTAQDVATVLYQVVTPQHWGPPQDSELPSPYVGVPDNLIAMPTAAVPDTIVVDHGKVYLSAHTKSVCHRLGINIQPATPHKPTDKPTLERFFRTLRQQLLEHLPAYKGPDVYSRGQRVEDGAFYYVSELETIIREWIGIYHHTPHRGLCDPRMDSVELSPAEMFSRGASAAGVLRLPASEDLRMEFLDVVWRTIQHYGVEIDGRRYDGPALNYYRGALSPFGGAHAGRWPIMVDRDDVRTVFFQDPESKVWHTLEWEHTEGLTAPFSAEAADYTRQLALKSDRHVAPDEALSDLLERHGKGKVTAQREKNLARRLASQSTDAGAEKGPEVIDLFTHLARRQMQPAVSDDLDVFEKYSNEGDKFEVFDE
jgi:putative transposase